MIKPPIVSPDDDVTVVGKAFSTPLVVKGKTWLPLAQIITWPIMALVAKKRLAERTWIQSFRIGALTMPVILLSEWCHNLAHAAAAKYVGKPMDAIRITWGMPLVVYHDINDLDVSPKQHILRALGGPIFNIFVLPFAILYRQVSKPNTTARDVADAAVGANTVIPAVGLLPIPGLDGGPILKWSLVEQGHSVQEADRMVRKTNRILGILLSLGGANSLKKRRWLLGGLLITLSALALSIAAGILKEQE